MSSDQKEIMAYLREHVAKCTECKSNRICETGSELTEQLLDAEKIDR